MRELALLFYNYCVDPDGILTGSWWWVESRTYSKSDPKAAVTQGFKLFDLISMSLTWLI